MGQFSKKRKVVLRGRWQDSVEQDIRKAASFVEDRIQSDLLLDHEQLYSVEPEEEL